MFRLAPNTKNPSRTNKTQSGSEEQALNAYKKMQNDGDSGLEVSVCELQSANDRVEKWTNGSLPVLRVLSKFNENRMFSRYLRVKILASTSSQRLGECNGNSFFALLPRSALPGCANSASEESECDSALECCAEADWRSVNSTVRSHAAESALN